MGATPLEKVLSRLQRCSRSGTKPDQYVALCPAHDDTEPSLAVGMGEKGGVLLHCFRGCTKDLILEALRMTPRELYEDTSAAPRPRLHNPDRKGRKAVPPDEWARRCAGWAVEFKSSTRAKPMLAQKLQLPESAFEQFDSLGVRSDHPDGPCWVIPERDGAGNIVGAALRFVDGKKKMAVGSSRGLTIPNGWKDRPGPLFIPEGFSDVAALTAAGLCAVGRPGVNSGLLLLTDLVRDAVESSRQVVVLGENDQKADGSWPGRDESLKLAQRLARETGRPVMHAMPPGIEKDARSWLTNLVGDGCEWPEAGQRFLQLIRPVEVAPAGDRAADEESPQREDDGRVRIHFLPGHNEMAINDEVISIVIKDQELFTRSCQLVTVTYADAEEVKEVKFPPAPAIVAIDPATLRERISNMVHFTTEGRHSERSVPPPDWCYGAIIKRGRWRGAKYLQAVIDYPFLRPDGSLVSEPGYDRRTAAYLFPHLIRPELPEVIDHAAAVAAWEQLSEVVCDFPFAAECHKSSWLCGLLTPLARFAFDGPTPLFLVDGNTPGAGKGKLCHVASIILTGQEFATVPYSHDSEEMRKKITTFVQRGVKGVMFDNISGHFGGSVLDAMLTSTVWEDRLLGTNTSVIFPLLNTNWATGNNIQIAGDCHRRISPIRLESPYERPEERTDFEHEDLEEWVKANRPRLLGCALTILIAYFRAGRPKQNLLPWGSYEGWSKVVRSAVVWIGLPDPALGKGEMRESSDPAIAAMDTIVSQWVNIDPENRGLTANQIIQMCFPPKPQETPTHLADLADAITSMCPKNDGRNLGARFKQNQNRIFGGRKLAKVSKSHQASRWGVLDVLGNRVRLTRGESGEGGESVPASRPAAESYKKEENNFPSPARESDSPDSPDSPFGNQGLSFSDFDKD